MRRWEGVGGVGFKASVPIGGCGIPKGFYVIDHQWNWGTEPQTTKLNPERVQLISTKLNPFRVQWFAQLPFPPISLRVTNILPLRGNRSKGGEYR
jgi:hypothetical protein